MKFLVTGATGFLGRHLCKALEGQGHTVAKVSSKVCDLSKDGMLNQFDGIKFDYIYHLAVWVQAGDFPSLYQGDIWLMNQKINTNVLSWWKESQMQAKLIAMGTSCAYAPGADLKEENYLNGLPHPSLFSYAMTKRMLYNGLVSLNKQYGMKYLCFAFSALYGTEYYHKEKQCHFIIDLIRKIAGAKAGGESPVLWGDGYQKRELLFVTDLVDIMLNFMEHEENKLVNVSSGEEHTIRHFAKLICDEVGYDFESIQYDISKYVGAKSKSLSNSLLKSVAPSFTFTPLQEGLKKTISWYLGQDLIKS